MASGFVVRKIVWEFTEKQKELLLRLNDPSVHEDINYLIGRALNKYVPKKSGALRKSMHATNTRIIWGNSDVKYAHYQYTGIVYGPNYPIWSPGKKSVLGWYSPPGGAKSPTTRFLGTPGVLVNEDGTTLWEFGYTTPGTESEWGIDMLNGYDRKVLNQEITNLLKRKLKDD